MIKGFPSQPPSTISIPMSKNKPKDKLWKNHYAAPGETPGQRDGIAPTGEKLEDINTREEEKGGFKGKEPTRYGDWATNGRCTDF